MHAQTSSRPKKTLSSLCRTVLIASCYLAIVVAADPLTTDQIFAQYGFLQKWVAPMPSKPLGPNNPSNATMTPAGAKVELEGGDTGSLDLGSKAATNGHRAPADTGEGFVVDNWRTTYKSIQIGGKNIAFVPDPIIPTPPLSLNANTTTNSSQVLQVYYPKGSYVPSLGSVTGGTQFYATPFGANVSFQSMMISYEVAFPAGFNYVLGGKLPGVYGGASYDGCSGGVQSTGSNCLTMRMMWRQSGVGEVYAYIPSNTKFCKDSNVQCNDVYGTSIGRGTVFFAPNQWTRIDIVMQLNDPAGLSNGKLAVYLNGNKVVDMATLSYRSTGMVAFHGLMFSSFFGGSDETYATPVDQYIYFKNIRMAVGPEAKLYEGSGTSAASLLTSPWRQLPSLPSRIQSSWLACFLALISPSTLAGAFMWITVLTWQVL
ncbi:hypothetical protein DFQ27_007562 [Actinomortierella ambigua]|uniref:Polysaccharide lyase 14 domain-containing protein n=1 Tax=Actinomortierella ambigua TaxID=1343610 RepID=A0A9P6QN62_9FUNG|nr:hypothetical protein DFQ27_007562 [Actinomortierella ambigua]